jgi:hypothetical protein
MKLLNKKRPLEDVNNKMFEPDFEIPCLKKKTQDAIATFFTPAKNQPVA